MNDPSVRSQFQQSLQAVQYIDTATKHTHDPPRTTPLATPQQKQPNKHTTIQQAHNESPYEYDTLQLSFLTTHYESDDDYTDAFPLYTVPHYITRKKHPGHDNYLYRRWNNPNAHKHKKTRKTNQRNLARTTTKDDMSVTPTLTTLSTLDTRSSHPTNIDPDTILSITIWKQPIVQYRLPIRPATTRNRSRPSIAVQHALIGVYDKLNSSKLPHLLPFFTSIICVVLSCFILLADSFTMVKIDDRYPDEWND